MRKDNAAHEADHHGGGKGIFVGDGANANYPALLLFLAGGILSGFSVYAAVNHDSSYVAFLIAALLCACVSFVLIVLKKGSKR